MGKVIIALLILASLALALDSYSVPLTDAPAYLKVDVKRDVAASVTAAADHDLVMELKSDDGKHIIVDDKLDYGEESESYMLTPGMWRIKVYFSPDSEEQSFGSFVISVPGHDVRYDELHNWGPVDDAPYWNQMELPSATAHGNIGIFDGIISVISQVLGFLF